MSLPPGPETSSTTPPITPITPIAESSPAPADADWTDQVTDLIVDSVDKVRARTTGPILQGARGIVYAIVALVLLGPILVLGMVGVIRLLNWAIPGDVWIVYALLGTIFVIVGAVLWSRRDTPATP